MPLTCQYCSQSGIPDATRRCPRCLTELSSEGRVPTAPQKVDDIRFSGECAIYKGKPEIGRRDNAVDAKKVDSAIPYRPTNRPPMVIIKIFDDGSQKGEEFRLRSGSFTIGRSTGNVTIPHDALLSSKHVVIENDESNTTNWFVRDLNSTNGTFAQVEEATMKPDQQFLLGSYRYRFEPNQFGEHAKLPTRNVTTAWQIPSQSKTNEPSIVQLTPNGDGPRFAFPSHKFWIGTGTGKDGISIDDPFLSENHAVITLDKQNRWTIKAGNCLNGIWLRVSRIQITKSATFQIGEQRFSVRIP